MEGRIGRYMINNQESQDGVPNLEDRGAQNIHSLDGTKDHPVL